MAPFLSLLYITTLSICANVTLYLFILRDNDPLARVGRKLPVPEVVFDFSSGSNLNDWRGMV